MPPNLFRRSDGPVELGLLLSRTVGAVVDTQAALDAYSEQRRRDYEAAPPGALAVPPLWYVFNKVDLELELAATVEHLDPAGKPALFARTLDPTTVNLYGHRAAAGLRIRVQVEPRSSALKSWVAAAPAELGTDGQA